MKRGLLLNTGAELCDEPFVYEWRCGDAIDKGRRGLDKLDPE